VLTARGGKGADGRPFPCFAWNFTEERRGAARAKTRERKIQMNAIVTVVGEDRVGIIAGVCTLLAENNVNILDITQTIMQGNFTMVMAVDVGKAPVPIGELGARLDTLGKQLDISIRIQREEIFDAMHRI